MGKFEGKGIGDVEAGQSRGWQQAGSVNSTKLSKTITNLISFLTGG